MALSKAPDIINFHKLIESNLNGGQLVSYSSRYLTKPGDNYGSVMLAVTANIKNSDGLIEEFPLVAKLPPITNDMYWKLFQPERTCLTENSVYCELAPALRQVQLDMNIPESEIFDGFPKCYGVRISLDANALKVDRDAVLLLENLQTSGYKAGNRNKMFDYAHVKIVLQNMAKFHGLPIALRILKPAVFYTKIRPHFKRFNMNAAFDPIFAKELKEQTLKEVELATNKDQDTVRRVGELLVLHEKFSATEEECADGLFTTITHFDMWINNIMILYDEFGSPCKLKFVDFQVAQYESLAHDLIFFLFSSVDTSVLEEHYDDFLKYYYNEFVDCLKIMDLSIDEYSLEKFMSEVKRVASIEVPHALFMAKIILADSNTMPDDFKDIGIDLFAANIGFERITRKMGDIIRISKKLGYFY